MHPILKTCLLSLPFTGLLLQNSHAQTANNINQSGTLVELCAAAQQDVMQDAANVQVSYKAENRDKRIAADDVNKKMTSVIALIKAQYPKIEITNQKNGCGIWRPLSEHPTVGQTVQAKIQITGSKVGKTGRIAL